MSVDIDTTDDSSFVCPGREVEYSSLIIIINYHPMKNITHPNLLNDANHQPYPKDRAVMTKSVVVRQ